MTSQFLTAGDVTSFRETISHVLPGTAVISSPTYVSDGGGGGTTSWTPSGTVACRLDPGGIHGREEVTGDRLAAYYQYVITLPATTAVTSDDRIRVAGTDYEVAAVRVRSWELSRRVEVNLAND